VPAKSGENPTSVKAVQMEPGRLGKGFVSNVIEPNKLLAPLRSVQP